MVWYTLYKCISCKEFFTINLSLIIIVWVSTLWGIVTFLCDLCGVEKERLLETRPLLLGR